MSRLGVFSGPNAGIPGRQEKYQVQTLFMHCAYDKLTYSIIAYLVALR